MGGKKQGQEEQREEAKMPHNVVVVNVAWGVGVLLRGTGKGSIKEFEIHPKNIYVPKLNEPI